MLFVDFSSAFNTVLPDMLALKLQNLGLLTSLDSWIHEFLTNRPQVVRLGESTSALLILNTGTPQGCVLSPLLFTLFTHNCFANNDKTYYREEVQNLTKWCTQNNLIICSLVLGAEKSALGQPARRRSRITSGFYKDRGTRIWDVPV